MATNNSTQNLSGNRGEWSEIYIFLTLASDGRVYAADRYMNRIPKTYLDILKIIREEVSGQIYQYCPGNPLKIFLNDQFTGETVEIGTLTDNKKKVWCLINSGHGNGLQNEEVSQFLDQIHIHTLKAPATKTTDFFGGTPDIILEVSDYKTNIVSTVGFSCKSPKATLFNASGDNTNFIFKVKGNVNDDIMNTFNSLFNSKNTTSKDGTQTVKQTIATGLRMEYLHEIGCDLEFVQCASDTANRNLILSGGMEMPAIVGSLLKGYFFDGLGKVANSSFKGLTQYLSQNNPANYPFTDLQTMYKSKIGKLLYDMFTGMRLGTAWNGRADVNGGYILVDKVGNVLAYHTCIADEFKDFLFEHLHLEGCSNSRHHSMQMYKEKNEYFIKFNLQVRFAQ